MGNISKYFLPEYHGFLFHYYRAEVYRETAWRNRLDITANWSVVVTAAILTFVFGNPESSHVVIIINYLIVWFFLYIESRRFRYYGIVRDRARLFEKHILGPIFEKDDDDLPVSDKWLNELAESLKYPKVKMSRLESLSWRLRRTYIFILPLIFFLWVYKVGSFTEMQNMDQFFAAAGVNWFPGWLVFGFMIASLSFATAIAFYLPKRYGRDDLP